MLAHIFDKVDPIIALIEYYKKLALSTNHVSTTQSLGTFIWTIFKQFSDANRFDTEFIRSKIIIQEL